MTQDEFIRYLHGRYVTPQGDLSTRPYELVASGEVVVTTFQSQDEVVAWLDKDDAE